MDSQANTEKKIPQLIPQKQQSAEFSIQKGSTTFLVKSDNFILRTRKKKETETDEIAGFAQITNSVFRNKQLSWKAKGVLGYLLTQPSDFIPFVDNIVNSGLCAKRSIQRALTELRENGYATLVQCFVIEDGKKQVRSIYNFSEIPNPEWLLKHSKMKIVKLKDKVTVTKKSTDFEVLFTVNLENGGVIQIQKSQEFFVWAKQTFSDCYKNKFGVSFSFSKPHETRLENLLKTVYYQVAEHCDSYNLQMQHHYLQKAFENLLTQAAKSKKLKESEKFTPAYILSILHLIREGK